MKTFPTILLFCCLISLTTLAQKNESNTPIPFKNKNVVHAMAGGHSLAFGIYYERILLNNADYKNCLMLGGMAYPKFFNLVPIWIPVTFNNIFSITDKHHIELGAGAILMRNSWTAKKYYWLDPDWEVWGAASVGYRYTAPNTPFVFRAMFTPLVEPFKNFDNSYTFNFYPTAGASVGYRF